MSSKVAFAKAEINWWSLIPRLVVIVILAITFCRVEPKYYLAAAIFVFSVYSLIAKWVFYPEVIYKSIRLIKQAKFQEAIPFVEESIGYYTRNHWIDTYRYLLMISYSKKTIRESCMTNLAYCYLQTGLVNQAKDLYLAVLEQYPGNNNAQNMLDTINIIETNRTNI